MALNNFLARYKTRQLKNLTIPGSHDAGIVAGGVQKLSFFGSKGSLVVTQDKTVGGQANAGSRFFDVRVLQDGGELVTFHSAPMKKLGFNSDSRNLGAKGQGFLAIMDELKDFVKANPSEFVIVRLTHLMDTKAVLQGVADWMDKNNRGNMPYVYKGGGNLANNTVAELAGQIVIVVEAEKLKSKNQIQFASGFNGHFPRIPTQRDGFHTFHACKHEQSLPAVSDGLCVCGTFANKKKLADIVTKQMKEYTFHDQHKSNRDELAHLYCVYWTATGGNIEENTKTLSPANFKTMMNNMVKMDSPLLKDDFDTGMAQSKAYQMFNASRKQYALNSVSIPNIVLYDFINDDVSNEIVAMNDIYSVRYV